MLTLHRCQALSACPPLSFQNAALCTSEASKNIKQQYRGWVGKPLVHFPTPHDLQCKGCRPTARAVIPRVKPEYGGPQTRGIAHAEHSRITGNISNLFWLVGPGHVHETRTSPLRSKSGRGSYLSSKKAGNIKSKLVTRADNRKF